jgi:carboxylesterase
MKKIIIPGAEPFFLPAGKSGCLLVHGFTGTPKEMRLMGDFLQQHNVTALGIRLTGHGTEVEDMARTRWQDWLGSVEDGLQTLRGCCDTIFVAGLSMGGLLSLLAASIFPVRGAIAMSTPYQMKPDWRLKFARLLSAFVPSVRKDDSDTKDLETSRTHIDYPAYPTRSVAELLDLIEAVHASLPSIKTPVLMVNSKSDGTVPVGHQQLYADQLRSIGFETVMLEKSGHVVTEDVEREIVFQRTLDFIKKHQQGASRWDF